MFLRTRLRCALWLLTLLIAPGLSAQTLDRGELHGTVRDQQGAAVPGAVVTARQDDTGFQRTATTGPDGAFVLPLLPLGRYQVRAERAGFAPASGPLMTLAVGQSLALTIELPVAGVAETVSVTAAGDTATAPGATLDQTAIRTLPINGRDYRDFALLAPTTQAITGTRGTFRVAGQPGDYLALNVDGADFTNNFFGEFFGSLERQNFTVPLEAVQEFQVSAGGLGAASGRTTGGLVNMVTKSGTNAWHGSAVYFLRHHALTADDAFGNAPSGLVRHATGGSLGGPLVKDRTFIFVASDIQRQTTPVTVRFARDVRGVAVPELGIADLAGLEGQFPRQERVTTLLGKLDHQLSDAERLTLRVNLTRSAGNNIAGGSTLLSQATSNLETFTNQGVSIVGSLNSVLGSRAFLETKGQFARETRPRSAQGTGPQVQIADTGTFGTPLFLPGTQDMYRYQGTANLSARLGRHELKAGADVDAFDMRNNAFALGLAGAYTFPTLEAFVRRQPVLYAQNFGLNGQTAEQAARLDSFWQRELAGWVQDRIHPTPRLTVGVGLRYDAQLNPQPQAGIAGARVPVGMPVRNGNQVSVTYAPVPQGIPNDVNNWGPRVDAAWQVDASGATQVKGAAGVYYGRTPMIYFPMRGAGVSNTTLFLPPFLFGVTFPQVLPSAIVPGSALASLLGPPAISYVDPGFNNPRVTQVNATVSRRVGGISFEAGYLGSWSDNLRIGGFRATVWDRNLAVPTTVDAFGRGVSLVGAPRPDTSIAQANALTSFGHGRYQALLLTVDRPLARHWQAHAIYTLARSEGNGATERDTEAVFGPSDPFNPEADYGLNEMDQRHQLRAYLVGMLPGAVTVASTWSAGSGLAFPVYSAVDVNGDRVTNDGLNPDRPAVNGALLARFPYHQPAWGTWDLRVAKGLSLGADRRAELVLDVFNVLNTANRYADARTQAILGSPNFRVNNRTLGPRMGQVGVRVAF